jgi:hypothetical protein
MFQYGKISEKKVATIFYIENRGHKIMRNFVASILLGGYIWGE